MTTEDEARAAIKNAIADPDTELILLTENWSGTRPEDVSDARALVVEIPAPGPGRQSVALETRIERALGVHLER